MGRRRIGILTDASDVPGLNSVIKNVVNRGADHGLDMMGIQRGFEGLTHVNLDEPASRSRFRLDLNRGNCRDLDRLGLDTLLCIGGDRTIASAAHLAGQGIKVVAIPKTRDNDVQGTEYCVGYSTATTEASDAIRRQCTALGARERFVIFQVFGRASGFTALITADATSSPCVIPEHRFDLARPVDMLSAERKENPSRVAAVILSEGASWNGYQVQEYGSADGHGRRKVANVAEVLARELLWRTGTETAVFDQTCDLRAGGPDLVDRLVAATFDAMAIDAVREGVGGAMAALVNGAHDLVPIPDPRVGPRRVEVATMYDTERYLPLASSKRGSPIFQSRSAPPAVRVGT